MSVIVYFNDIEKASAEAMAYGSSLANQLGVAVVGISSGVSVDDAKKAGQYGIQKVISLEGANLVDGSRSEVATVLEGVINEVGGTTIIFPHSIANETIVARLSIKLKASLATNVIGLPDTTAGFKIRKSVYTNKAFASVELNRDKKILTIKKNSFSFEVGEGEASVESQNISLNEGNILVKETKKATGDILLPEADLVVSAGRGLKGPENWGMIEELATVLGAGTACSKPVSDIGWRPHHEHVGQTGIKVSPNLYIAIGISGAIQHLAGVSSSKVIVVINTDPEAPFFKAADYGIVGDAFQVVPKLIEALKKD